MGIEVKLLAWIQTTQKQLVGTQRVTIAAGQTNMPAPIGTREKGYFGGDSNVHFIIKHHILRNLHLISGKNLL